MTLEEIKEIVDKHLERINRGAVHFKFGYRDVQEFRKGKIRSGNYF